MSILRIVPMQIDISWENKQANFDRVRSFASTHKQLADVLILPETFSTGFSMDVDRLAEANNGVTVQFIKELSKEVNCAFVGSFIARNDDGSVRNRAFFITPDGEATYYDKRHLFRMGSETDHFSAGNERVVVAYKGWNICLMVCYDLRFPVWSRNVDNQYDLLIYVANWPEVRVDAWTKLLFARAIENCCFVAGVNRVGVDNQQMNHSGDSLVIDFKGKTLLSYPPGEEKAQVVELDKSALNSFLNKFPAWKDADKFNIL